MRDARDDERRAGRMADHDEEAGAAITAALAYEVPFGLGTHPAIEVLRPHKLAMFVLESLADEGFTVTDSDRLAALEALAEAARQNRDAREGWGRNPASVNATRLRDSQKAIDAALDALGPTEDQQP